MSQRIYLKDKQTGDIHLLETLELVAESPFIPEDNELSEDYNKRILSLFAEHVAPKNHYWSSGWEIWAEVKTKGNRS